MVAHRYLKKLNFILEEELKDIANLIEIGKDCSEKIFTLWLEVRLAPVRTGLIMDRPRTIDRAARTSDLMKTISNQSFSKEIRGMAFIHLMRLLEEYVLTLLATPESQERFYNVVLDKCTQAVEKNLLSPEMGDHLLTKLRIRIKNIQ